MRSQVLATYIVVLLCASISRAFCAEKTSENSNKPLYVIIGNENKNYLTPSPSRDDSTGKIIRRTELEHEAYALARHGFYGKALFKYQEALNPSLLNDEYDKSTALWAIRNIHQRQGKLDLAINEHEWFLKANPTKAEYLDKKLELEALINARIANSNQPVYDYIKYFRIKYKKYIPPKSKGDSGFHVLRIESIIHLYDWMGDADGGIKFMREVLSSKSLYPNERKEYERVKFAFEEDKRTGQKGHLQKVIETSDFISW